MTTATEDPLEVFSRTLSAQGYRHDRESDFVSIALLVWAFGPHDVKIAAKKNTGFQLITEFDGSAAERIGARMDFLNAKLSGLVEKRDGRVRYISELSELPATSDEAASFMRDISTDLMFVHTLAVVAEAHPGDSYDDHFARCAYQYIGEA